MLTANYKADTGKYSPTNVQLDAEWEPKGAFLTDGEFNEMLPRKEIMDQHVQTFSEMLAEASGNQQKLYDYNNLGIEADINRIPDNWQLDEDEYNKINAYVAAPSAHKFPRDMDNMNFSEELAAATKFQNDN